MIKLRPYQEECLASIKSHFYGGGVTCQGVSGPTGMGKGALAGVMPETAQNVPGESLLFIAHRHELIDQAIKKFRQYNPELSVGVERASQKSCPDADIVIASVQSLTPKRITKFDPERFRVILIDEIHHSFCSDMYQHVMEYFGVHRSRATLSRQKLLVGFSATWRRGDGKGAEHLFDKIVFHRSILDIMRQGIYVGDQWCPYLAPIRGDRQLTETSLDKVRVSKGDFEIGELSSAVNTPQRNSLIVDTYLERGESMPAVAFTADIQHSTDLAKAFQDRGINFRAVSGKTPPVERDALFRDYELGKITGLVSAAVITEGVDLPRACVGINAAPCLSILAYTQKFGRITRPFPAPEERLSAFQEGRQIPWVKPYGIWIDFTDSSTKHSLIQAPTLFGLRPDFQLKGKSIEEVIKAIEEAKAKQPNLDTKSLKSLDDLTRSSVAFSSTAAPQEDASIRKWSVYPWQKENEGQWALPVRGTNTVLRVKQREDGAFGVWAYHMGAGSCSQTVSTLRIAIKAAEQRLDKKERKILQRDAPWRRDPPTPPQSISLYMKSVDLRKQFPTADRFYSYALTQYQQGDMAFSKGSIADQLNVFLMANRYMGPRNGPKKSSWIAKASANVRARFK